MTGLVDDPAGDELRPRDDQLAHRIETGTGELRLDLTRRLAAEALGTALLVVAVIGSGIAASRLSSGDVGLQLLESAAATAGALIGLILMFGAVSGAHLNPVVTLLDRALGTTTTRDTGLYVVAQVVGGSVGAVVAAVTVARTLSDTFAGIAPGSAPMFVLIQLVGAVMAYGLVRLFYPHDHSETS